MGCTCSAPVESFVVESTSYPSSFSSKSTTWREKGTQKQRKAYFLKEGTILKSDPPELLELRLHLDDPMLLQHLSKFALRRGEFDLIMCWTDILEFMSIPEVALEYRISKGVHIFCKFIAADAPVPLPQVTVITDQYRQDISHTIRKAKHLVDSATPVYLPRDLFSTLQHECLQRFCSDVFVKYKSTIVFKALLDHVGQATNVVKQEDFEYFELLGCGSFGFVVHCVKTSTQKHYAMKVQSKRGLLDTFHDNVSRVTLEKDVVATCHHPFIVSMDYAFQTTTMVMMVMDLGTAGTLQDALKMCKNNQMSLGRVRFYCAEIYLALLHIHRLGLIYRDLKPANVVLCEDGHIKLVDLGGTIDVGGGVAGNHGPDEQLGGICAPDYDPSCIRRFGSNGEDLGGLSTKQHSELEGASYVPLEISVTEVRVNKGFSNAPIGASASAMDISSTSLTKDKLPQTRSSERRMRPMSELRRASSMMGTEGYIAPEMLALHSGSHEFADGYTRAVDIWSLGCVMVELLTGAIAFTQSEIARLTTSLPDNRRNSSRALSDNEEKDLASGAVEEVGLLTPKATVDSVPNGFVEKSPQCSVEAFDKSLQPYLSRIYQLLDKVEPTVPVNCYDIVSKLLEVNEVYRLGCDKHGSKSVKSHDFFRGISWSMLGQKQVTPPFVPPKKVCVENPHHDSCEFGDVIANLKLESWLHSDLNGFEQQLFSTWDYVNPEVIKLEINAGE